ncbi:MAG: hypothetical protein P9M15_06130 [Candidatus Electryoneaceae bacterium]|nr:hypothetical protein [Candidatus Electryoneaceae bacterium]
MNKQRDNPPSEAFIALVEQVQADLHEIKEDIREMRSGNKDDQKVLWNAMNGLRESITGNSREGLLVRVDRNTGFRRTITKLLWVLFTPLYGGLIALLLKTLFFNN